MTHVDASSASTLLTELAIPAARALLLAAGGAFALAVFRVKATSLRLFAWTGILYAALAMPLLGRMLPPLPVDVPAFLAVGSDQSVPQSSTNVSITAQPLAEDVSVARGGTANRVSGPEVVENISVPSVKQAPLATTTEAVTPDAATPVRTPFWASIQWSLIAAAVYVAITLLLLARLIVGVVFSRRLARSARTIREQRVAQRLASRAYASGLTTVPRAAESELISVPVTVGAFRSLILLPAGWGEWDDAKLDAVIAHEVSHVARGDALTQRLSLLHRAIFWFSPLAWWLDRHLADLAELASDEAALSCGTDRNEYAKTLLGFFEALQAAPGRVWWQGVSMAKAGQAEERVERILAWKEARGAVTMGLKKSISLAIIAIALPAVYVAASVRPTIHDQSVQDSQTAPPAAATSPKPSAAVAPPAQSEVAPMAADEATPEAAPSPEPDAQSETVPDAAAPSSAPVVAPRPPAAAASPSGIPTPAPNAAMAPVAPSSAATPRAAWNSQSRGTGSSYSVGRGYSYAYGYDEEQRFVIVSGKSDSLTMSGSSDDARHVEKLKKVIPGDFIWFELDEKSYVIRDQATIDRARKLWAPQEELGKKQEALGNQQEALGRQQEELGAKMEEIRVQVPDMSAELDHLRARLQKLGSSATMEQIGDLQSEIGELQSKIGEIQSHAGDQQSKLGEEMGALGAQQGKLGEQQGELGRQQGELARQASREMKKIFDEALKNGTAQPEPQSGGMASL
jgi:beta-lactamase regulating signal transducer with metallopeptidase domain